MKKHRTLSMLLDALLILVVIGTVFSLLFFVLKPREIFNIPLDSITIYEETKSSNDLLYSLSHPAGSAAYRVRKWQFSDPVRQLPVCLWHQHRCVPIAACSLFLRYCLRLDKGKSSASGLAGVHSLCGDYDLLVDDVYQAALGSRFLCGDSCVPDCWRICLSGSMF